MRLEAGKPIKMKRRLIMKNHKLLIVTAAASLFTSVGLQSVSAQEQFKAVLSAVCISTPCPISGRVRLVYVVAPGWPERFVASILNARDGERVAPVAGEDLIRVSNSWICMRWTWRQLNAVAWSLTAAHTPAFILSQRGQT